MPAPSARSIWQDSLPASKVSFAEAYNTDRWVPESQAPEDPLSLESGGEHVHSFLARFQDRVVQQAAAQHSKNVQQPHYYTAVRSDLDEEKPQEFNFAHLPPMPRTFHGVGTRAKEDEKAHHPGPDSEKQHWLFACIDSQLCGGISGLVIVLNALVIGLETDIVSPLWYWMDQFMLAFFVGELMLKLLRHGTEYFKNEEEWIWNWFDLIIVLTGAFDQWFMPAYAAMRSELGEGQVKRSKMTVIFMLLRMARLLRIVRLFRLIKIIRPLYELAQGILEALQGMFWVLVFMAMTLYATAMLCTLFIGAGEIFGPEVRQDEVKIFRKMFSTVESSLFALFGTMSSWSLTKLVPLFRLVPAFRLFFVVFYIYSAWALLAVMTGVVSENMIAIREQMLKEDEKKVEARKQYVLSFLGDLFRKADLDGSGQISRDEFDMMLRSPELIKKLSKYSKMEPKDLEELFEWIDHDNSGTINLQEFMDGFKWINEPLRAKSLVKVHQRLGDDTRSLSASVIGVIELRFEELTGLLQEPMRKVHAICEQMQNLDATFGDFADEIQKPVDVPTQEELRAAEQRLSIKLKKVCDRLAQVEAGTG